MINQVVEELKKALKPSKGGAQQQHVASQAGSTSTSTSSFGSSNLIASCLNLMNQF